ncbi:MAG TPA: hypothetical protein DCM05_03550 [Elusimicrobia bacterium]|nr:hypothetical protein [Elusimicrobiota bacterium]
MRLLLLALLLAGPAQGQTASGTYMPPSGSFVCNLKEGWTTLEERSPQGMSVHLFGPASTPGLIPPAYHIHLIQKDTPGFLDISDAVKKTRKKERFAERTPAPPQSVRYAGRSMKLFEVRERRRLPAEALPSEAAVLHHFYAFIPAGDDYFIVKLTVDEEEFEDYRQEFRGFLKGFQIIGRK